MANFRDILTGLLNEAKDTAVPLAQKYVFGQPQGTPEGIVAERIDKGRLNGSGPNDADAALQQPQTFEDLIAGNAKQPEVSVAQATIPTELILIFGAIGAFLLLAKK